MLDFEYIVDPTGRPGQFGRNKFDVIVSAGVMEHIPYQNIPGIIRDISTLLKPGGFSTNSINIRDHLYAYDKTVSKKQYMAYSDKFWKTWFANDVQYINRFQRSQWLEVFQDVGLDLVEEEIENVSLSGVRVSDSFQKYDETDLKCGGLKLVHCKPK